METPAIKRICDAFEAGIWAFRRGIHRAPVLDPEFGPSWKLNRYPTVLENKAWLKGWDTENLLKFLADNDHTV